MAIYEQFTIPHHIQFTEGPGGFIFANIHNRAASAKICLYGGQITAYQPKEQSPVIWVSDDAIYSEGKAIRGGVPICWPWFGNHPNDDTGKPAHGFARTSSWSVILTDQPSEEISLIQLQLNSSRSSLELWPYPFELILSVLVGVNLNIELIAKNTGDTSASLTTALHSYFQISHVDHIKITGLEGCQYIDKFDSGAEKRQTETLTITQPTDRVYLNTDNPCAIIDSGLKRQIQVKKSGSQTTVVWNPWAENAAKMRDFGNNEYTSMVCLEAANALNDSITLAPGESHTLSQSIQALSL